MVRVGRGWEFRFMIHSMIHMTEEDRLAIMMANFVRVTRAQLFIYSFEHSARLLEG